VADFILAPVPVSTTWGVSLMAIIQGLLSTLALIATAGLFIKRFRKRSAIALLVSVVALAAFQSAQTDQLDAVAQEAGFANHQDFLAAQEAGVSSPDEWQEARSAREEAERERIEQIRLAQECGDTHSVTAFVMSQRPVTAALRAPSTAEFPNINSVSVSLASNCQYVINAYVDAQNGFGAQIRTIYRAVMQRNPDSGSWRVVSLDM